MMKFETLDGNIYEGLSYLEIVDSMAAGKLAGGQDTRKYMEAVATRIGTSFPGVNIDTSTVGNFVESLVGAGFLRSACK